jgi:hypothetical protein
MKMAVLWHVALAVWYKFTNVPEVLAASVIVLMMEAASTSEKSLTSTRLQAQHLRRPPFSKYSMN